LSIENWLFFIEERPEGASFSFSANRPKIGIAPFQGWGGSLEAGRSRALPFAIEFAPFGVKKPPSAQFDNDIENPLKFSNWSMEKAFAIANPEP
jgi:hypothetical protein